jgi:hypothetical protein
LNQIIQAINPQTDAGLFFFGIVFLQLITPTDCLWNVNLFPFRQKKSHNLKALKRIKTINLYRAFVFRVIIHPIKWML